MYVIDLKTGNERYLKEDLENRFSLSDNVIYYIYHAPDKSVWVGTMFGGVNYIMGNPFYFKSFLSSNFASSKEHIRIRGLSKFDNGQMMIGSEAHGTYLFNPNRAIHKNQASQQHHRSYIYTQLKGRLAHRIVAQWLENN